MLKIYDQYREFKGYLDKYKDLKIVEEIGVPDSQMSFILMDPTFKIRPEWYVVTEDAEYVVKETPYTTGSYPTITCVLNLEDWAEPYEAIQVVQTTIANAVNKIIPDGWSVASSTVTKERNAGMMHVSALEALQKMCAAFMCEFELDVKNKTVRFAPTIGQDRGAYFMAGLNLKKLTAKRSSYDYYTRIIPLGKDGLDIRTVNNGLNYLENYQYSDKVIPYIWKNEDYTDAQALKDDAELYLDDLSKPEVSYSAEIRDLAAQSDDYSALDFSLGDTITLIDLESGTREKQRIKRITRYPGSPDKNTCEIGNTVLTFEEMQDLVRQSSEIVNYVISNTGNYSGTITVSGIIGFEAGVAASSVVQRMQTDIATARQAAALAQDTADGKNTVMYAIVPPVGTGLKENDIWFDTDDGNTMYRWDGERWEKKVFDTAALAAECIDTAHLRASAVTAAKIATGTITADKINVNDLFAQNITATGTISGATLTGTNITASAGNIGGFVITRSDSGCANKTSANGGHAYVTSLYAHSSDSTYEYEAGMKGDSGSSANIAFYIKRIAKGAAWSTAETPFYIGNNGKLYAQNAEITGKITATSGSFSGSVTASTFTAKNTVYLHNTDGTRKVAMTAPDLQFGSSLSIGAGFDAVYFPKDTFVKKNLTVGENMDGWLDCNTISSVTIYCAEISNQDGNVRMPVGSYGTNGNRVAWIGARVSGSYRQFRVNGQWGTTGSTYTTYTCWSDSTSDIRLKENIEDTEVGGLEAVKQMKLRQFDWKKDGTHSDIGFVADELEEIDPELALGGGYDEDGQMDEKQVSTYKVVAYLTKAVQELSEKVDTLERMCEANGKAS